MKVTKVSATVLDAPPPPHGLTPRQLARQELEKSLEKAISDAHGDASAAFRLRLDAGEKVATIRGAFGRAKTRAGHGDVNLFKVGDDLFIAARPQKRGRRPKAG